MYTCNMHRIPCGLLHCLHPDAAAVAGDKAAGLPRRGPALLFALAAPVGVGRPSRSSRASTQKRARARARRSAAGCERAGAALGGAAGGARRATVWEMDELTGYCGVDDERIDEIYYTKVVSHGPTSASVRY